MNIAVIHGYLLRGTGSNLYVQNLCRELCRLGYDVSLFCQENETENFDFIAEAVDFAPDNKQHFTRFTKETEYPGKCICYRPNLSGFLPVYVYDHYEGYNVKEFTKLTKYEIEIYLDKNSTALSSCFKEIQPRLILSNHIIMQPVYSARACRDLKQCTHFMTVHGSGLNFSVRKSELLKKYAKEAVNGADKIIFVSNYSRKEFLDFFKQDKVIAGKAKVIPAGVDVDKFTPLLNSNEKSKRINYFLNSFENSIKEGKGRTGQGKRNFSEFVAVAEDVKDIKLKIDNLRQSIDNWAPDQDIHEKFAEINWFDDTIVLYYGKYLWTKGIHLLVAAAPLILQRHPNTHFILVGFGSFRGFLEALVAALEHNKRNLFIEMLAHPNTLESEVEEESAIYFSGLLEKLQNRNFSDSYFSATLRQITKRVIFTGYLSHDSLKDLIPSSDVTVATSIFPEAFGMVAVEALASGIIPIQTNHSGFSDVIHDYVMEFRNTFDATKLKPLHLNDQLVLNLANNISILLDYYKKMSKKDRQSIRHRAQNIVLNKYSWFAMAQQYLALWVKQQSKL